jgi:GT2 family glycosyltransferase
LAKARNTALERARGDILVYVDVDAYADVRFIESLLGHYTGDDVGGVGGQGIESNIGSIWDRWRTAHASQGFGPNLLDQAEALSGIASSYRTAALREVGGFDPWFRTNGEDTDISIRLRKAGYRLVYTPEAIVYHQRKDDFRSLHHTLYRWFYWGYMAKKKNGELPLRFYSKLVFRNWVRKTGKDLLVRRDLGLAAIDATMFVSQLLAISRAACGTMKGLDINGRLG